jgi:glycine/D-amino acid oxidase-like deaminating enzyme
MMPNPLFTESFKSRPYWWDSTPVIKLSENILPGSIDVLVVGSGFTGLSAALQTARGGRSTLVVDTNAPSSGCSSRNGGQVSNSLKPDYESLRKRVGETTAKGVILEGLNALNYMDRFIHDEEINCDWMRCGRFVGAHNRREYKRLSKKSRQPNNELALPFRLVQPREMHTEIGTKLYHGGCVYPDIGSLHPGKYSSELLRLALQAGAQVQPGCEVTRIERQSGSQGNGFVVATSRGRFIARDVIIATNGYTGKLFPGLKRRIIPIGSYLIATEPLSAELMQELLPTRRMIVDTRKLVYYYRACPEGKRILFGGRVAISETDPVKCAPKLHMSMCQVFPQLRDTKISHAWMGFVGYTFDEMPHIGQIDGLHYSMGYCGSGVSLSSYFGMKIGQQVLGNEQGDTPLSNVSFQTRPYYNGKPWFLAPSILYYRLRDRIPV